MARKTKSKKGSDNSGCLTAMIEIPFYILVLLFSSKDPSARKVGWGIVGFIVAFGALVSMGASGGVALGVILAVAVIIIVIAVALDASKGNSSKKSEISASHMEKGSEIILPNKKEQTQTIEKGEDFEIQLDRMKRQAKYVTGQQISDTNEKISPVMHRPLRDTESEERFVSDVASVCKEYDVPESAKKVLISSSQIKEVAECPALMWNTEGKLHMLALLREPVLQEWNIESIPVILFEKIENENQRASFQQLEKEPVGTDFSELFPDSNDSLDSHSIDGVFALPNGVKVSMTSGKNLFSVLPDVQFYSIDGITQSQWYPSELRDLYQQHILLETGVLSKEEYAKKSNNAVSEYISKERNKEKAVQHLKEFKELELVDDKLYSKYFALIMGWHQFIVKA